jgi:hypothetical protein
MARKSAAKRTNDSKEPNGQDPFRATCCRFRMSHQSPLTTFDAKDSGHEVHPRIPRRSVRRNAHPRARGADRQTPRYGSSSAFGGTVSDT